MMAHTWSVMFGHMERVGKATAGELEVQEQPELWKPCLKIK